MRVKKFIDGGILGYLSFTLLSYPDWWSKEALELTIRDYNVYTEIRRECLDFEKAWSSKIWEDPKEEPTEKAKSKKDSKAS